MEINAKVTSAVQDDSQYSLTKIVAIWAAAVVPMVLLAWVVTPFVAAQTGQNPGFVRVGALTLGLMWQFVLVLLVVWRDEGDLRWSTLRRRLWLNAPRDPKTGVVNRRLWLWLIPIILLVGLENSPIGLSGFLNQGWVTLFPFLAEPEVYSLGALLASPESQAQLVGAWWLFGLFAVLLLFNTFLGEELLFRGVLLPKMGGAFGRWDWVANGVLFGLYHLHQPWMIPGGVLTGMLLYAYPSRRFRTAWMGIIAHSSEAIFLLFLLLGVVLGLA